MRLIFESLEVKREVVDALLTHVEQVLDQN